MTPKLYLVGLKYSEESMGSNHKGKACPRFKKSNRKFENDDIRSRIKTLHQRGFDMAICRFCESFTPFYLGSIRRNDQIGVCQSETNLYQSRDFRDCLYTARSCNSETISIFHNEHILGAYEL